MAIDRGGSTAKRKPKNNKRKPAKNSRGNERRGTSVKTKPKKTSKPSRLETQERKSSNKPRQTMVKSGATAARENPANIARRGAQSYIIKDKAQTAVTMPVKVPSGILKNAQNGVIRTAGGGNTRSDERLTNKTQREHYQSKIQEEKDRQEQIEKRKKAHEKNGYKYGDKFIKTADKFTKTVDEKFDKAKEKDLEYGASVLSDTKHDVPIYTKYAKGKAKEAAKASLKESGVTQKAGREVIDKWVDKTEKEWKKDGYDIKDDTVITEDGKTWGQVKQEAYDSQSQHIKNVRADYINKSTRNAGKMSAKDLYKAGVPMASEFIDYGVPYMATAKVSLKVAEAIMKKAAKAGKVTGKSIPKVEKAVEGFVKSGNLDPKAAEKLTASLNRKIAAKSAAKTLTKEGIANALQDATIGTTIDLAKGLGEGLKGEELEDYMKKNALFNLAFGAPLIGVAGASGAKTARREMAEEFAGKVNASINLSKADGIKLENLLKKQQKGDLSTAEIKTLETLQQKALKEGGAIVDSKGKVQVNQSRYAAEDLTRPEVAEYYKYKAQDARGTLDPRDRNRFNELQYKVDTAYKRTESFANDAINIKDRKIKSKDQGDIENAIRFFERTGDKAKLERANHALEIAKAETRKLNDSLSKAMDVMEEKTGIKYEWIDDEEMFNRAGVRGKQGYTDVDGTVVVNRDSPQAWQEVLGHETGHLIKKNNTEAFEKFGNQLEQYSKDIGEWDYVLADMKQRYPELDFNGEEFREEVVSEMVGKYIFGEDGKFLKRLAGEDPTLFERIIDYIKNLVKSSENKELAERLSKITDDVSNEIVAIKQNAENIKNIEDGRKNWSQHKEDNADIRLDDADLDNPSVKKVLKERDDEYFKALDNGDAELCKEIVRTNLFEHGFKKKVYQGTPSFGYTSTDFRKLDDRRSIFATDSIDVARTYTATGHEIVKTISDEWDFNGVSVKQQLQSWLDEFGIKGVDLNAKDAKKQFNDAFNDTFNIVRENGKDGFWNTKTNEYITGKDQIDKLNAMRDVIDDIDDRANLNTGGIYEHYANTDNLLIVECDGGYWNKIEGSRFLNRTPEAQDVAKRLSDFDIEYADYRERTVFNSQTPEDAIKLGKLDRLISGELEVPKDIRKIINDTKSEIDMRFLKILKGEETSPAKIEIMPEELGLPISIYMRPKDFTNFADGSDVYYVEFTSQTTGEIHFDGYLDGKTIGEKIESKLQKLLDNNEILRYPTLEEAAKTMKGGNWSSSELAVYNFAYERQRVQKDIEKRCVADGTLIGREEFVNSGQSNVYKTLKDYRDDYTGKNSNENQYSDFLGENYRTSEEYTTRNVSEFAANNGYSGVEFRNLRDTMGDLPDDKDLANVYVFFDDGQLRSADYITRDNNGNVIPPSERGNAKVKDYRWSNAKETQEPKPTETEYKRADGKKISAKVRWSQDYIDKSSRLAPVGKDGMHSKAWEVARDLKGEKFSTKDIPKMLEGKQVKTEELKWTGFYQYIEDELAKGKKSLTKQEIMDYFEANTGELKTVKRLSLENAVEEEDRVSREIFEQIEKNGDLYKELYDAELERAKRFAENFGLSNVDSDGIARSNVEDNTLDAMHHAGYSDNEIRNMFGVDFTGKETKYENYMLPNAENYREYEYIMEWNDYQSPHWDEEGVVLHSRIGDFSLAIGGQSLNEKALADIVPKILELQKSDKPVNLPLYGDLKFNVLNSPVDPQNRVGVGLIRGDDNLLDFRVIKQDKDEIVKELPNMLRGLETTAYEKGGRVLYVDEIQSDLHNKGHKKGYATGKDSISSLPRERILAEYKSALNDWREVDGEKYAKNFSTQLTDNTDLTIRIGGGVIVSDRTTGQVIKETKLPYFPKEEDVNNLLSKLLLNKSVYGDLKKVPDAPYKKNYTDYAMKRALREAVENDYEYLAWSTGEIHDMRWQGALDYSVEYDTIIPKFMKKYVKEWGGKVEKIRLAENGAEVWGVKITDEMRKSIQEKGQKRWSNAGKGAVGVDKDMATFAEELFKKGHDPKGIKALTGWSVGKDGKARLEFSDADMRLKFKMKDVRRGKQADIDAAYDKANELGEKLSKLRESGDTSSDEFKKLKKEFHEARAHAKRVEYGIMEGRLGDLIDHKELFKYYPQLEDVVVGFTTKTAIKGNGEYYSLGNAKFININQYLPKEEMLDTLIHEIQHAIQEEEGFAGGSSTEYWEDVEGNIDKTVASFQEKYPQYEWAILGDKTFVVRDKTDADTVDLDTGEIIPANSAESKEYVKFNPNDKTISFGDEFKKLDKQTQSDMTDFVEAVKDKRTMSAAAFNDAKIYRNRLPSEYSSYRHTVGEWEAEETANRRNMSQSDLDKTPRLEDETPIVREDFDKWYGKKFSQAKVEDAKSGIKDTKAKIAEVDKKFEGKLSETRRKELEQRRRTLEEQLAKEELELNKLNRPLYEKRLADAKKRLKELEAKKNKAKGDELVKINKQITSTKSTITRNENLIKNEPKQYVSDIPPKSLTDDSIKREYNSIQKTLRDGKGKSVLAREAREERLEALRKEAEKRGVEVRGNIELADELIKEKRFGWEEAKSLKSEINELDNQISALNKDLKKGSKTAVKSRSAQIRELENERAQKNTRLSQVIENSKSVVPEGKTAREVFDEVVGGNTLKPKGSGKKFNAASAIKYIEENGGKGAVTDIGRTIRRKTESSLIEYETAGKTLMKNGYRELGQSLLDQTNNVIVYKNKAAAAVESHRASADGTKVGESLNDVFKVKDKHGKVVNLLLEENAKMRNDLSNYLFCKHSFARDAQGKKVFGVIGEDGKPKWTTASSKQYMDEIVEEYGERTVSQFERSIREYIDYLNEYRLDTGLISKELLDELEDIYPYYIPTNRAVLNKPPTEYELPRTAAEVDNGIKRAVGGDEPLEDLYTQLVKMTMATIRSGEQNKMVAMYAKAHGIEPATLPKDATADDILESSIDAFDSNRQGGWKIRFYQDGKAVTIPVNRHAAKGLREFNGQDYATLMAAAVKVGKTLHMREYKGLITDWNVVFGVRNGMRDSQQALVNSKDTRWYVRSIPRAMAAITDENNAFRILYDANGGRYSTLQQINRLDEIGALNEGKSTVMKGLQKIEDFNGIIEMKPRMQEFIGTIQKEADQILGRKGVQGLLGEIEAEAKVLPTEQQKGWIEREYAQRIVDLIKKKKPDIIATAIRNSADITVNFSRSGVVTRALNVGFVPYLNPSVQGLSKMMRMFTESKAQGFGKLVCFGAKLGVLTIAPSVVNEVLCQDNEAYQRINTRDKDNAFFIPMSLFGGDKDKFIKIPKPRENAVLAEPFEYGVRLFLDSAQYGTPDEFEQMFRSAQDNVGVVSVWQDNIISPVANTIRNKTWYGGDILSKQELENIENEEAWKNYDETTSLLGKEIGKKFNISPKKVDNIMDSYFGLVFDFGISQTSQKNINDVYSSPKNFLMNNPITQQFTKDTVFSNKYAVKFWDNVDELNKGHKGGNDTIEKREYMAKYGYDTFTYDTAIANIDNDENIPKTEKVEMKRELRKYKNQLLHRALEGKDVVYDPMQRIINLYKDHGIKNATDVCLSTYADGDHADAYKHLKQSKEYRDATPAKKKEWQRKFLKTYKDIKKIARFTGDSDKFVNYSTVEYVCVKNGYTKGHIANMYAWKSKEYAVEKGMENMKKYIDDGYTEKNFKITMRELNRGADSLNDEDKRFASQLEDYNKAMINAEHKNRDGAFLISSPYMGEARMNAARCLVEGHSGEDYKWTDKRINKFCKKYDITHDKKYKYDNDQVIRAINKEYADKTPEEKAAVFVVITGDTDNNPFGNIGDYSHKSDTGAFGDDGGSRRGRGGHGGGGGGGGGSSSGGTMPKTKSGAIKGKITDPFSTSNGTKKSNLDDAYRKRVKKLLKK